MEEHFFQCPYCWQEVSVLLDTSVPSQSYIEDCEVCCRPFQITYQTQDHSIESIRRKARSVSFRDCACVLIPVLNYQQLVLVQLLRRLQLYR